MKPLNAMKRVLSGAVVGALFMVCGTAQAQTVMEWMNARGDSVASVVIRPSDNVVIRPSDNVVIRPSDNVVIRPSDNVVIRPSDNATESVVIRPSDNRHYFLTMSRTGVESVVIRPSDNRHHSHSVVIRPSDNLADAGWFVINTGAKGELSAVVDMMAGQSVKVDTRSTLQAEAALSLVDSGMTPAGIDLDMVADAVRDLSFSAGTMSKIHDAAALAVEDFVNGSCGNSDNLTDRLCDALR